MTRRPKIASDMIWKCIYDIIEKDLPGNTGVSAQIWIKLEINQNSSAIFYTLLYSAGVINEVRG